MWQLYALAPGTASSTHRICHMPPLSTAAYVSVLFTYTYQLQTSVPTQLHTLCPLARWNTMINRIRNRCQLLLWLLFNSERRRRGQSWDGGSCAGSGPVVGLALHGSTAAAWRHSYQQQQLHHQVFTRLFKPHTQLIRLETEDWFLKIPS